MLKIFIHIQPYTVKETILDLTNLIFACMFPVFLLDIMEMTTPVSGSSPTLDQMTLSSLAILEAWELSPTLFSYL